MGYKFSIHFRLPEYKFGPNFYYPSKIMAHCGEAVIYSLLGDGR